MDVTGGHVGVVVPLPSLNFYFQSLNYEIGNRQFQNLQFS